KPDLESRLEIFKIHTQGKPLSNDVDLKKLSKITEGLSGAEIASICQKASMAAVRETLRKNYDHSKCKITPNHFQENLKIPTS
ncbi:MAG: AAA family ATPase, partial [Patescibacteria group bacterium]